VKKANWSALYAGRSGWRRTRDRFEYGALRSWERDMFQILCARVPEGGSVLSVGCGRALLDYWLARVWGSEVHLLDLSQACLDKVSRSFAEVPHQTYRHDALELPFEKDRFDLVWNAGVWEHFAEDEIYRGIAEMCRTSKRHVVASVPYAGCKPYLRAEEWLEKHDQWDPAPLLRGRGRRAPG
jgi:ubiquinone/menaquinone biosynthesis C-methylase UbiE